MRKYLTLLIAGLALGGAVVSCDTVDEAFDCHAVCSRYHDCYDQNYDVGKCQDVCRAKAAHDDSIKQAADTCESCIGDKSCLSATFECGSSCSNIVP